MHKNPTKIGVGKDHLRVIRLKYFIILSLFVFLAFHNFSNHGRNFTRLVLVLGLDNKQIRCERPVRA